MCRNLAANWKYKKHSGQEGLVVKDSACDFIWREHSAVKGGEWQVVKLKSCRVVQGSGHLWPCRSYKELGCLSCQSTLLKLFWPETHFYFSNFILSLNNQIYLWNTVKWIIRKKERHKILAKSLIMRFNWHKILFPLTILIVNFCTNLDADCK